MHGITFKPDYAVRRIDSVEARLLPGRSPRPAFWSPDSSAFFQTRDLQMYAFRRDHDVAGFQIAMDDPLFMRGFQRRGDLAGILQSDFHRQRSGESRTLDELHHQRPILHCVDLQQCSDDSATPAPGLRVQSVPAAPGLAKGRPEGH
jgi:hypothetical protein